jgi:penicillin-insensitive murein endopeptidase
MRHLAVLALSCSLALLASVALARPACNEGRSCSHAIERRGARSSRSIGQAWDGRLENGVLLRESANVRYVREYRAGNHFYGTWQLVALLERAAARVARRLPGAKLSVGELSARTGGALPGHRSHQSGRDADVSFYMVGVHGRSFDPFAFAVFGADGKGRGPNRMLRFDDARNWELVARLLADPDARVQHLFVSDPLRQRLLREGRRRSAPSAILDRAALVMSQPSHGQPHANHFHVRIYCSPGERRRCRDRPPFHPWYPGIPSPRDVSAGAGPPES